jgi:hypothetical protein
VDDDGFGDAAIGSMDRADGRLYPEALGFILRKRIRSERVGRDGNRFSGKSPLDERADRFKLGVRQRIEIPYLIKRKAKKVSPGQVYSEGLSLLVE